MQIEGSGYPEAVVEFIQPAVEAIPASISRRLKPCLIELKDDLSGGRASSRWTESEDTIRIELAAAGCEAHDLALELLRCLGQALWERIDFAEEAAWLALLHAEIEAGVTGEIDEDALVEKRRLLSSRAAAASLHRLKSYACASFASTAAEYVHCLWHDVTVRAGEEHLPAQWLRRRLELMQRWFPPDEGRRLFG